METGGGWGISSREQVGKHREMHVDEMHSGNVFGNTSKILNMITKIK